MKRVKLLLTVIFVIAFSNLGFSQTFHAIIFADTNDNDIGESVIRDYYKMEMEMGMIATTTQMSLKTYYNIADNANKSMLMSVLNNLRCEPSDVVFFYYSGHGGRAINDKSKYPQIRFDARDAEAYPLYKIDEMIAEKKPKFRVIMGDMCNSVSQILTAKSSYGEGSSEAKNNAIAVYQSLFKNIKGSIIVASSEEGETSTAYANGGAFTTAFLDELQKIVSGNNKADWKILLENTQKTTYQRAKHTPIFEIQLGETTTTITPIDNVQLTNNPFINALINMADNGGDKTNRVRAVTPVLNEYFSSPTAIVETYSRNGEIRLTKESAQVFLERVSTSYKLINFVELSVTKADNGKITYIKLHEIYKQ